MSVFIFGAAALGGCGDDSTDVDMVATLHDLSAVTGDMAKVGDFAVSPDAAGMSTLKINDYLNWCSVAVNGGAASTADPVTLTFPTGTVVNLVGDKASPTFVWGYWRGTAGDTSATHDTAKTTTVTLSGNKTVQACCPFASAPTTPCPDPT